VDFHRGKSPFGQAATGGREQLIAGFLARIGKTCATTEQSGQHLRLFPAKGST
jgi:hypothetical protein